jgi:hypothetical protein
MKIITMALMFAAASVRADTGPIYFYWTPTGGTHYNATGGTPLNQSAVAQYDAYFEYSGGTTIGGVFTPTGLISYSFGTPFGVITPATHYPSLNFFTDTPFGPSFNIQGTITPVPFPGSFDPPNQAIAALNLNLEFNNQAEITTYFQNGTTLGDDLTGTWTETIISFPDSSNSVILLGIGLAALGFFHCFRRRRES